MNVCKNCRKGRRWAQGGSRGVLESGSGSPEHLWEAWSPVNELRDLDRMGGGEPRGAGICLG